MQNYHLMREVSATADENQMHSYLYYKKRVISAASVSSFISLQAHKSWAPTLECTAASRRYR